MYFMNGNVHVHVHVRACYRELIFHIAYVAVYVHVS